MISSIEDVKKFLNDKKFEKIYILSGKKSFITSGAKDIFSNLLNNT